MLKSTKPISKPTVKKAPSVLKNEKQKSTAAASDKNALEKKALITKKKSDSGLSSLKNVKSTKTKSQAVAGQLVKSRSVDKPAISVAKSNVMNTIHNVTVASPPTSASTKGRSISLTNVRDDEPKKSNHMRTRTRTIAPEDSLLYQQKIMKLSQEEAPPKPPVKNPVAYEINFEEAKVVKKEVSVEVTAKPDDEDGNYSSDFESYESDFEAEPSGDSSNNEEEAEESLSSDQISINPQEAIKDRIDSGSFDMSTKKSATHSTQAQYDSIDDTVNSHDSGISYDDAMTKRILSPKVSNFYKRGEELMKKITFDTMTFDIYEQKPIPYEVFMSVYGQRGMSQACTQSDSQVISEETQTENVSKSNMWTQYPAKFTKSGLEMINSKIYNEEKLGVGDEIFEDINELNNRDEYDMSISAINNFSSQFEGIPIQSTYSDTIELNKFIKDASISIFNIIEKKSNSQELQSSKIPISRGFTLLKFNEIEVLRNTIVTKIYTNLCLDNFFVTIHKKPNELQNFMCLWNTASQSEPIKIFSAYSDIKCLEIHPQMRDVIVGGCNDGTICMWDIQEINELKNEMLDITMPCGIISLSQIQNDFSLDNVCALKSLPHRAFMSTKSMFHAQSAAQICSLHENGTLSIWTILCVEMDEVEIGKNELNFTSNNSKIKLVKNFSIDLTKFTKKDVENPTRMKSAFEKTKYYFENDLFSDKVLQELQEIDTDKLSRNKNALRDEVIRVIGFDVNYNELFIASDSNYIVALSRLCLGDKSRKIITNESSCISPTAMKIHPIDKSILTIGQSDGSVKFVRTHDEDSEIIAKKRTNLKRSNAATSFDDVLSKSCAFQNIVEKEKKLYVETQALNNLESDELKAFMVSKELSKPIVDKNDDDLRMKLKIKFDKNIFNSFDVCMGSVRVIEFSKSGEFMFILVNKKLRIFNCWKNVEVEHQDEQKFNDLQCIHSGDGSNYLILLTTKNEILVNKLK